MLTLSGTTSCRKTLSPRIFRVLKKWFCSLMLKLSVAVNYPLNSIVLQLFLRVNWHWHSNRSFHLWARPCLFDGVFRSFLFSFLAQPHRNTNFVLLFTFHYNFGIMLAYVPSIHVSFWLFTPNFWLSSKIGEIQDGRL